MRRGLGWYSLCLISGFLFFFFQIGLERLYWTVRWSYGTLNIDDLFFYSNEWRNILQIYTLPDDRAFSKPMRMEYDPWEKVCLSPQSDSLRVAVASYNPIKKAKLIQFDFYCIFFNLIFSISPSLI